MPKPTELPEWAESAPPADVVAPSLGKQAQGWVAPGGIGEAPAHNFFNWWQRAVGRWTKYLRDLETETFEWLAAHTFRAPVEVGAASGDPIRIEPGTSSQGGQIFLSNRSLSDPTGVLQPLRFKTTEEHRRAIPLTQVQSAFGVSKVGADAVASGGLAQPELYNGIDPNGFGNNDVLSFQFQLPALAELRFVGLAFSLPSAAPVTYDFAGLFYTSTPVATANNPSSSVIAVVGANQASLYKTGTLTNTSNSTRFVSLQPAGIIRQPDINATQIIHCTIRLPIPASGTPGDLWRLRAITVSYFANAFTPG